jgi:hypothetical protein
MEQSPSEEADRCSGRQEILCHLCSQKVHYHVHKSLPVVLSEPDKCRPTLSLHFLKVHPHIVLSWTPRSSTVSFLEAFQPKFFLYSFAILHTLWHAIPVINANHTTCQKLFYWHVNAQNKNISEVVDLKGMYIILPFVQRPVSEKYSKFILGFMQTVTTDW